MNQLLLIILLSILSQGSCCVSAPECCVQIPDTQNSLSSDDLSVCVGQDQLIITGGNFSFIPRETFVDFGNLTVLKISGCNALTTLTNRTINGLNSLRVIFIDSNNALTTIEGGAISGLKSLDYLRILSNSALTTIEAGAFSGSNDLSYSLEIYISDNNALTSIETGAFPAVNADKRIEIYITGNIALTTIKTGAFSGVLSSPSPSNSVISISSNSVLTIETRAFSFVNFHGSVSISALGIEAGFFSCSSCSLDSLSISTEWATLLNGTFSGLNDIYILSVTSNTLTTIEAGAFSGLNDLSYLSVTSNTLTTIDPGAFSGLSNVETISFPNNRVTTLEGGAFFGLSSLVQLDFLWIYLVTLETRAFQGLNPFCCYYNSEPNSLSIDDATSLSTIETGAFIGLTNLTSLNIEKSYSLTTIEPGAFTGLSSLTSLTLKPSSNDALTAIEAGTFDGLSSLKQLTIDGFEALSTLELGAFADLTSLEHLFIRDTALTTIEPGLFSSLSSLTSLTIRISALTTIEPGAFAGLNSLSSLDLQGNPFTNLDVELIEGLPSDMQIYICYDGSSCTSCEVTGPNAEPRICSSQEWCQMDCDAGYTQSGKSFCASGFLIGDTSCDPILYGTLQVFVTAGVGACCILAWIFLIYQFYGVLSAEVLVEIVLSGLDFTSDVWVFFGIWSSEALRVVAGVLLFGSLFPMLFSSWKSSPRLSLVISLGNYCKEQLKHLISQLGEFNDLLKIISAIFLSILVFSVSLVLVCLFTVGYFLYWTVLILLGSILCFTKLLAINSVHRLWGRLLGAEINLDSNAFDNKNFQLLMLCELVFESIPQLIIQSSNNSILENWTWVNIVSFLITLLVILRMLYKYIYYVYYRKHKLNEIPVFELPALKQIETKELPQIKTDKKNIQLHEVVSNDDEVRNTQGGSEEPNFFTINPVAIQGQDQPFEEIGPDLEFVSFNDSHSRDSRSVSPSSSFTSSNENVDSSTPTDEDGKFANKIAKTCVSLDEFLSDLGLGQYIDRLREEGFNKVEQLVSLSESDFKEMNVRIYHRKVLVESLRDFVQNNSQ